MNNFKNIHMGEFIRLRAMECGIEDIRVCNFIKCTIEDLKKIYSSKSLDTDILLRLSKIFEYDFFRIYSQHLILYAPIGNITTTRNNQYASKLPKFRKNIYTKEIIDFILSLIESGRKTKQDIIEEYKIPKTTLYKWIEKHKKI